jgi:hypothetical protein
MAKKTAAKKATPAKKATGAKASKKKAPAKKAECIDIQLDPTEVKAFELAHKSEQVCKELELAVTQAMAKTVQKVFKQHDISLTASQSEQVALLLFGD